jgi:hypothetical protein
MKKLLAFLWVIFLLFGFLNISQASLLSNGDFEDTSATVPFSDAFTLGSSAFGEWYAQSNWTTSSGGPTGSFFFAEHIEGTGDDQKFFQPIDTSAYDLTGYTLTLEWDYFLTLGLPNPGKIQVGLIGLTGVGAQYVSFGGAEIDGSFTNPSPNDVLAFTELTTATADWASDSLTTTLSQDYDALVVAFGGWGYQVDGSVQGIDNVSLSKVPEPATMLLLGCSLLGLAGLGRRKFFKK